MQRWWGCRWAERRRKQCAGSPGCRDAPASSVASAAKKCSAFQRTFASHLGRTIALRIMITALHNVGTRVESYQRGRGSTRGGTRGMRRSAVKAGMLWVRSPMLPKPTRQRLTWRPLPRFPLHRPAVAGRRAEGGRDQHTSIQQPPAAAAAARQQREGHRPALALAYTLCSTADTCRSPTACPSASVATCGGSGGRGREQAGTWV